MASEGEFPKVDGDILYASEVNSFHNRVKQVYTGSALDNSTNGTTTTLELTQLTFGNTKPDYLEIDILGDFRAKVYNATPDPTASVTLKIETKYVGGAYSTAYNQAIVSPRTNDSYTERERTFIFLHTLTNDEKDNGVQVKLSISIVASGNGTPTASFTNTQIIQKLVS